MKTFSRVLCAVALFAASNSLFGQSQPGKPPRPAVSRADEMLELWNDIGNRLVAMAKDFPEDKYDFKVQKDQRTFAQNILHAAGVDFIVLRAVSGSTVGPDLGKDAENPSRAVFKTKADVVKLIEQAVSEGAKLIKEQGDAGLDKTGKFAFGNRQVHNSYNWILAIEHSGEHYGQLVVYYRASNMVPPESRPH
jgi:DinB superfamily